MKAFLLEAGEENATETRAYLEKAGFQVEAWAQSGTGWIAPWQKSKPDLVVVALQLPKRDGLYCIAKMRELDPHAHILFVHRYGGASANDVEIKAMALGAMAVVAKGAPASRWELSLRRLKALIQKR